MIRAGSGPPDALRVGGLPAEAAYIGAEQVWPVNAPAVQDIALGNYAGTMSTSTLPGFHVGWIFSVSREAVCTHLFGSRLAGSGPNVVLALSQAEDENGTIDHTLATIVVPENAGNHAMFALDEPVALQPNVFYVVAQGASGSGSTGRMFFPTFGNVEQMVSDTILETCSHASFWPYGPNGPTGDVLTSETNSPHIGIRVEYS